MVILNLAPVCPPRMYSLILFIYGDLKIMAGKK